MFKNSLKEGHIFGHFYDLFNRNDQDLVINRCTNYAHIFLYASRASHSRDTTVILALRSCTPINSHLPHSIFTVHIAQATATYTVIINTSSY